MSANAERVIVSVGRGPSEPEQDVEIPLSLTIGQVVVALLEVYELSPHTPGILSLLRPGDLQPIQPGEALTLAELGVWSGSRITLVLTSA